MSNTTVYSAENDKYRLSIEADYHAESPREWDNIGTMVYSHRRYILGDEEAQNIDDYNSWEMWFENEVLKPNGGEDNVVYMPLYLYDHSGLTMNTTGFHCPWDSGQVGWIYATKEKFREGTGYTEDELFSMDSRRIPRVGEHVKLKNIRTGRWGAVVAIHESSTTSSTTIEVNYGDETVRSTLDDVKEVMHGQAKALLASEVETFDSFLRGDIYGFILETKDVCVCCGNISYEAVESCWGFYGLENVVEDISEHLPSDAQELLKDL